MRYHGTNSDGEPLSSAYVEKDGGHPSFSLDCSNLPSATRQEYLDECDINKLMSQYEKTGILPTVNRAEPAYLDVSDFPDLREAMDAMRLAGDAFMSLPALARAQFDNDPVKFVAFAEDPANIEKMREWKLAPPAPVEAPPQKVEVINPPAEKTA